tara:strand:- start:93 stop:350 length:258 start_codon:yes stop_codon:yes gene_type:complete
MVNQAKVIKITQVMKKAEELALKEIDKDPENQLIVAAGLMAVTRNLYLNALGPHEAQKMFEVITDSFAMVDEIYHGVSQTKPTIH